MTEPPATVKPAALSIALVVAAARNRVIGNNGAMPWYVPGDLKTFRRLTMGRPVIMGRKTFQAIGRALDGRTNIVITRDPHFAATGIVTVRSLDAALAAADASLAPDCGGAGSDRCVMVIGGGEVYRQALPVADLIYMTQIAAEPKGDTWFPELDPAIWRETSRSRIAPDPRDAYSAELITYQRMAAA